MDILKIHLLLNYYPAIGVVIAALIFIGGIRYGNIPAQRFALKLVVFFAVFTLAVVLTGEIAAQVNGSYVGGRADALSSHKLIARGAFVVMEAAGIAAIIGLVRGRRRPDRVRSVYAIFLILTVISAALLVTAILKGRQVKWAAAMPDTVPAVLRSTDTENKLWHA